MSTNITSVALDTPLVEAANIMRQQHLSSIVIVEKGLPVGIVTEQDMSDLCARLLAGARPPALKELMNTKIVTINSSKPCEKAALQMQRHKTQHLIATDYDGLLCGLFNRADLLRARGLEMERQYNETSQRVFALNQTLEETQAALQSSLREDPLLGIGNRIAMDEALTAAATADTPYSIAVLDIDHFKRYNDYYNHAQGNQALIRVCQATQMILGEHAQIFRQSGNTLLALFVDDEHIDKHLLANTVLQGVSALSIEHATAPLGKLSASIGLACCFTQGTEPNHVVFRALSARELAKHNGGNQLFEDTDHQQRAA